MGTTRTIAIDTVTRVEGHGKVTIELDQENRVQHARLHVVEFRGFERFIQGRLYWEVPVIVQRLCGICPVSHHLAAAKAMDRIVGVDRIPPTAEKMRLLMHFGQFLQSHALHFFYLASPDMLFGFDAAPERRNVVAVAREHPEVARQGVLLRKYGQQLIEATAGKRVHGTGAVPGGINKNLSIAERDAFLSQIDQIRDWARGAVRLAADYTGSHLAMLADFGSFPSSHLAIVGRTDGRLELYDGVLRALTADGETIFDRVPEEQYASYLAEEVRSWSYMKFPFIRSQGPEAGWYRVGPLARLNVCDRISTPEAEEARSAFFSTVGARPCNVTLAYHWARMIELLHAAERIHELLEDPDLQGTDLVMRGERRPEAVAVIEAPRGTLIHHYCVDDHDQVTMANLIVATTHNNEPMNQAITRVARDYLDGQPEITEAMLNHVEVAIRAYDPCLSCATHALGAMRLTVEIRDAAGRVVSRRERGE